MKYKDFSKRMDVIRRAQKRRKLNVIGKVIRYITILIIIEIIIAFIRQSKEKREFNKKYKTVVKVNTLGFKSYEFHERD